MKTSELCEPRNRSYVDCPSNPTEPGRNASSPVEDIFVVADATKTADIVAGGTACWRRFQGARWIARRSSVKRDVRELRTVHG